MRVLVTGASSLIGQGVVRRLAERGDEAVCFQRSAVANLADMVEMAATGGIEQRLGDVRDSDAVHRAADGCDAIVHLAAKVGVIGDWESYRSVNVDGTSHVIDAARECRIQRLVHVSSPSVAHGGSAIVGAGAEEPVTGRTGSWYAESKSIAERLALAGSTADLAVTVVRPHLVWGPGDTQLVGRIVERARQGRLALVGGGRALVDTTYVDNAVDALIAALDAVEPGARCAGRAYVIANGEPRPVRDLVAGICAAAGVEFAPRDVSLRAARRIGSIVERAWPRLPNRVRGDDDEPPLTRFIAEQLGTAHWFDPRPAAADLGWTPTVSIDEGLRRLAAHYSGDSDGGPA